MAMDSLIVPARRAALHACALAACALSADAAAQAFSASALPVGVQYPTSLQFGPDGRLYVSEQFGVLYAYTVQRTGPGQYAAASTETITAIRTHSVNHDDGGGACSAQCGDRQVTGLLAAGTAQQPVLYVTSSDARVAVGSDSGLDTNSGTITRLTCAGIAGNTCTQWNAVDIVRGLPRSEENHAPNGMAIDPATNMLYVAIGGSTNKGAASGAFAGRTEYFLSAAILSVDLDAIAALEAANGGPFTDPRSGTAYVYDLPTLDDPTRANIVAGDPQFPYPPGHPRHALAIDVGDPFGGNNGLNQAIVEPGGPVQVHSPGYRNPYDVLVTANGTLYTWDNGANSGWGGTPYLVDAGGNRKGYSTQPGVVFDAAAGDYCINELNEQGSSTAGDALKRITGVGFYGGHPAPIRAFPQRAGVYNYQKLPSGHWEQSGPIYSVEELLPAGYGIAIGDLGTDPRQCEFDVLDGALEVISASTNGLAEYTASNFDGALQGDLLAAAFNGNIYRCKPDAAGDLVDLPGSAAGTSIGRCEVLLSGFGAEPLDVTTLGDATPFPGTIWAATYGANSITIFEPIDFGICDPSMPGEDADDDGYTNGDEQANGTNPCSGGSRPADFDGDLTSDRFDADDDADGRADVDDPFALDAANGTATALPLDYPLFGNSPGTGLFGLGFTGLMLPRDGSTHWLQLFDPEHLTAGGAAGRLTVEQVGPGDARGSANTQRNGFMFGIDADVQTPPFAVTARLTPPYFERGGSATSPVPAQSHGLFIGDGDQDDYIAIVLTGDGGVGIAVTREVGGVAATTHHPPSAWGSSDPLAANAIDLYLQVDPQALTAQPQVSFDGGATRHALGAALAVPASWLAANDAQGLAVGAIATSRGADPFGATWDRFAVEYAQVGATGAWTHVDASDEIRHEGGFVQAGDAFLLIGGREDDRVRSWNPATGAWTTKAASPVKLHHMQAVTLDGLVYVAGAFTGECCAEPPAQRIWIYDPLRDRWSAGPAWPAGRARGAAGVAVHGGKLYIVSGNPHGHQGPATAQVDVYDPAAGTLTPLADIPHPRDHFFVHAHAGKLYAVGGRDSNAAVDGDVYDDTVAAVDVYTIATNTWTTLPAGANLPVPRAAAASGIIGNELIIAGGESSAQATAHAETHALDLTAHTWRALAPMRTPRHATQAIVSNDGFYVAAGSTQRGGPDGAPVDLDALHLFGATAPAATTLVAGALNAASALEFPTIALGDAITRTLTLTNSGGQGVVLESATFGGSNAYTLVGANLPRVLAPGASTTLTVRFAPTAPGNAAASLTLAHSAGAAHAVTLNGAAFDSGTATVLYRVNVGGPQVAAADGSQPAWSADTAAAPSALRTGDGGEPISDPTDSGAYPGPIVMTDPSLPPGAPAEIFLDERWDPAAPAEMTWRFPVPAGTTVEVRLLLAELYAGTNAAGQRVFDARVEGQVPPAFAAIDRYALAGPKGALMRSAVLTVADGVLDLELLHGNGNPAVNAIEIVGYGGPNAAPVARDDYAQVDDGGSVLLPVLANDSDADGLAAGSVAWMTLPQHGALTAESGGWRYQHDGSDAGSDRFSYTVRDARGAVSNAAYVHVQRRSATAADADGDGVADAADGDDDNDGVADTRDPFALDADNGRTTRLPLTLPMRADEPGSGLFGLGFTGVMSNGRVDGAAGSDYAALFDRARVYVVEHPSGHDVLTLTGVDAGDARGAANTQTHAFQRGIAVDAASPPFVVRADMLAPWFDGTPQGDARQGVFVGAGDQDRYAALLIDAGSGALRFVLEQDGAITEQTIAVAGLTAAQQIGLALLIDPATRSAQPLVALDAGAAVAVGNPVLLPPGWLAANDAYGLAIGVLATSAGAAPFTAHWTSLSAHPLAADDVYSLLEDTPEARFAVLANDGSGAPAAFDALIAGDRGGTLAWDDAGTPSTHDDRLRYTPAANFAGVETFGYRVRSTGGVVATAVVAAAVTPVNDPPAFAVRPGPSVAASAGAQTHTGFAHAFAPGGGADEANQTVLGYTLSNDAPALFTVQPTIDAQGTLRYTPAPGANGIATLTARVRDSGGNAHGGSDTSAAQVFTITVSNAAPPAGDAVFADGFEP